MRKSPSPTKSHEAEKGINSQMEALQQDLNGRIHTFLDLGGDIMEMMQKVGADLQHHKENRTKDLQASASARSKLN